MTVLVEPVRTRPVVAVISSALGTLGFVWGSFAVLLTDLSQSLQLAPGRLGLALTVGMLTSLPIMGLAGRVANRAGCGVLLAGSAVALAVGFAGLAGVVNYAGLLLALTVLSAASGTFDVGVNTAAMAYEQVTGQRRMALIQAAFSTGGAIGALTAGALLASGVPFRTIYLVDLVPLAVVVLAVAGTRFPQAADPTRSVDPPRPGRGTGLSCNRPLLGLAAVAALGFLAEAAMEQWAGVYLRSTLGLPALTGAVGVAAYHASMAVGRLVCAGVINRLGEVRTLRAVGFIVTGAMLVALTSTAPVPAVAGFLVVGLALSAVLPTALTLAGAIGTTAGAASSLVTTAGYGGFLLGPVLVGALTDAAGLRTALGIVAISGAAITVLAATTRHEQSARIAR